MVNITTFHNATDISMPRRLLRYVLIWCSKGKASIIVDDKELILGPHQVLTITSGQIHYFKDYHKAYGIIMDFALEFFCKDDADIELIFNNGLFCHFDLNEVIAVKNHLLVDKQLKQIGKELQSKPYQYLYSIHALIQLILIEINRTKVERGDEIYKPDALFLKFLELVRKNFKYNFPLSHFAKLLNTTVAKLNEQSKIHTGRTALNVIHGLIASEAKRLIIYESLSVKEVANKLGFKDPLYFSHFFKKHTRHSPKLYQNKYAF